MSEARMTLHCGGKPATLEEIGNVELPEKTRSYTPVPHLELDALIRKNVLEEFGQNTEIDAAYGLSAKGKQLFATLKVDSEQSDTDGLAIAFRNSYDKSMSVGIAGGLAVWICDNLAISGDSFKVLEKHTTNVWERVLALAAQQIRGAGLSYRIIHAELEVTKTISVKQDEGYEFLGRALGHQIIAPLQSVVAFQDWREPRHEEFGERTLYSLYNAVTEGLKKGAVTNAVGRHTGWHDYVRRAYPQIVTDTEMIAA